MEKGGKCPNAPKKRNKFRKMSSDDIRSLKSLFLKNERNKEQQNEIMDNTIAGKK